MAHRFSKKRKIYDLDLTGLYAYMDVSHARDRELWRGFLSCVLPSILPYHSDVIDNFLTDALVESAEDLAISGNFSQTQNHAVRTISAHIAQAIGVPTEFALASFYNCDYAGFMPTKLYQFHYKQPKKQTLLLQEENMVQNWLANFEYIRSDKQFLDFIETMKGQLL